MVIDTAPRFDMAILGKSDLPALANSNYALECLFSDLLKKQPAIHCLLLVCSYLPSEGNNLALAKASERHRSQLAERGRILSIATGE